MFKKIAGRISVFLIISCISICGIPAARSESPEPADNSAEASTELLETVNEYMSTQSLIETQNISVTINPNAAKESDIAQGSSIKVTNANTYPVDVYILNITGNYNNSYVYYSTNKTADTSVTIDWKRLGVRNSSKYIAFNIGGKDIIPGQKVYLGQIQQGGSTDYAVAAKTGYAWEKEEHRRYNLSILVEKDPNYIDPETLKHTVTFDATGGIVYPASARTDVNGKLSYLPVPSLSYCTFAGWFDAPVNGTRITETWTYTGNTTIYAQWDVTITFHGNGGNPGAASRTIKRGAQIGELPACTNIGSPIESYNSGTTGGYYAEWNGTWNLYSDGTGSTVTADYTFLSSTTIYATHNPVTGWIGFNGGKDGFPTSTTGLPDWMYFIGGYPARNFWLEQYCCASRCWTSVPGVGRWFWFDANGIMARGWRRLSDAVNNTATQVTSGGGWYYFLTGQAGHGTNSTFTDDTLPLPPVCIVRGTQAGGAMIYGGTFKIDGTSYTFANNGKMQ